MNNEYEIAKTYIDKGLLKIDSYGDFELFCYTKDCFFNGDSWDDVTKSHRGKLYYKGVPVNNPLKKIFNLNEYPDTSADIIYERLAHSEYEVYDKCNGHLLIVSAFLDENNEQQIVVHTKGSLPNKDNELLLKDIELLFNNHGSKLSSFIQQFPYITMMFEAVVEHDKHTLYDKQCEQYNINKNGFVLLACTVMNEETGYEPIEANYQHLVRFAAFLDVPVVKLYKKSDISLTDLSALYDHTDIEGYVIRFLDDNLRVKIKTKEYWLLRFKKDLTIQNVIRMFNTAGFDRIRNRLPEEVAEQIISIIREHYASWYIFNYSNITQDMRDIINQARDYPAAQRELRRAVAQNTSYTKAQKLYLLAGIAGKTVKIESVKSIRQEYVKFLYNPDNKEVLDYLQERLEHIVDTIGV